MYRRRSGRIQPAAIVLSLTVLALFGSTTLYVVICILYYQYDYLSLLLGSTGGLLDGEGEMLLGATGRNLPALQACVSSTTLKVNVVLGDAIVWWRACVIWRKNRVVKAICGLFLLSTFILGVVDASNACEPGWYAFNHNSGTNISGFLFKSLPIGTGASVLSPCTNLVATLLVAYKAWWSRRRLKGYLTAKVGGSQMEKLFALLVESGAVYCAIWTVIVAYQITCNDAPEPGSGSTLPLSASRFLDVFGVIMNRALVPAIAIYPTIIIVLVTLNRSHMERGLTQHLESLPTPRLALTVNTVATQDSRLHRRSEVLVIDEQLEALTCGDEQKAEGSAYRLVSPPNVDGSQ